MSRRTIIVLACAVLLALAAAVWLSFRAAGTRSTAARKRDDPRSTLGRANVLLITLDTTRADRLGAYGYSAADTPRLDRLAREGVLFEETITPTAFTLPSHTSIMTGLYPPFHGIRLNGGSALADVHATLAEQLADAGYRCDATVGAFVLDKRWGLDQGFDHYDDDIEMAADQRLDLAGVQRTGDRVVDAGLSWLDQPDERPFFAWFHFYDPHIPYEPPEPFKSRFAGRGKSGLYDGEIAFADVQVGRLLDWLDQRGIADSTVVVVVGDHGESLGDHGEQEHGYYVYDATVHVPLIIRVPGADLRDVRVPAQVRTIDVMPTVLDLVGVEVPSEVQGESLVPLMLDPGAEGPGAAYSESMSVFLQYGWSALYSLRDGTYKFVDAPRSELYDLRQDPGERHDLIGELPDTAEAMRGALASLREAIEAGAPETEEADLDQETLGMLAALGYVGGATAAPKGEDLADPKDKIHIFESVGYASHLMTGDDYDEAIKVLQIVLDADPEVPQARLMLASAYRQVGRNDDAKALLDPFLRENPDNTVALITMANILTGEGKDAEVLALAERVLATDDRNTQACELIAGVHMRANDHAAALPWLERAVETQPKLTRPRLNLAVAEISLGRLADAESQLDTIIADHPKFPLAHYHLGLLYEHQGRLEEARAAYAAEVELYDSSVMARFNLGDLLYRLGDLDGAEQQMRVLIEQAPNTPRPYLLLARVLLKQERDLGEVERLARAGLERAETDEQKVLGYYLLADVYSRQGRQAELQQVLERAQFHRSRIEGRPRG